VVGYTEGTRTCSNTAHTLAVAAISNILGVDVGEI